MSMKAKINLGYLAFFIIVPLAAIVGVFMLAKGMVPDKTIILAGVLLVMGGFGITAGYHRLLAHKTYKAVWPVRLLLLLAGSSAFENSALEWCNDHRDHHRYTDTEKDPYNIKKGFWYAHMGWILVSDNSNRCFDNVEDLTQDPLVAFQHKYYSYLAIITGVLAPMFIAGIWGDWLGGLLVGGALRIAVTHQTTFCINSVCHYFGKQTYSERYSARDNWFTALFTLGEGFHNFHHRFPIDYRNGVRAYDFDPTKWLIKSLHFLGLAKDLRKIKAHRILESKLEMDRVRLQEREVASAEFTLKVQHIYDSIIATLKRLEEVELMYKKSKALKPQKKEVKSHLKVLLKHWEQLMHFPVSA